jgi:hypothetical protein
MDSSGSRIDSDRFDIASEKICETLLKLPALPSRCQPSRLQNGNRSFDLAIADGRLKKRNAHAQPLNARDVPYRRPGCMR